jgi:prepilin-type processing-associated H-X9-DG protein
MSAHDLFDEVFGQLDETRREVLDRLSASDQSWSRRRVEFRRMVQLMVHDDELHDPPPALAQRALALVVQQAEGERAKVLDLQPPVSRFRWSDFAVAATIFIASLLALVPAMNLQRASMLQMICTDNLRQVGLALSQYGSVHRSYPFVSPECPGSYIGSFGVLLADNGLLQNPEVLTCPCRGRSTLPPGLPHFSELCEHEKQKPGAHQGSMRNYDYAYAQGVRTPDDQIVAIEYPAKETLPLAADAPAFNLDRLEILDGNSPNHGGRGQNVLFAGGHVKYQRGRKMHGRDQDLYLNEANRVAPGLHSSDAVLTPAVFRFSR